VATMPMLFTANVGGVCGSLGFWCFGSHLGNARNQRGSFFGLLIAQRWAKGGGGGGGGGGSEPRVPSVLIPVIPKVDRLAAALLQR